MGGHPRAEGVDQDGAGGMGRPARRPGRRRPRPSTTPAGRRSRWRAMRAAMSASPGSADRWRRRRRVPAAARDQLLGHGRLARAGAAEDEGDHGRRWYEPATSSERGGQPLAAGGVGHGHPDGARADRSWRSRARARRGGRAGSGGDRPRGRGSSWPPTRPRRRSAKSAATSARSGGDARRPAGAGRCGPAAARRGRGPGRSPTTPAGGRRGAPAPLGIGRDDVAEPEARAAPQLGERTRGGRRRRRRGSTCRWPVARTTRPTRPPGSSAAARVPSGLFGFDRQRGRAGLDAGEVAFVERELGRLHPADRVLGRDEGDGLGGAVGQQQRGRRRPRWRRRAARWRRPARRRRGSGSACRGGRRRGRSTSGASGLRLADRSRSEAGSTPRARATDTASPPCTS